MHLSCKRDALSHALTICADLCRAFPEIFFVTLHAHSSAEGPSGSLDVLLWNEANGIGVMATVPAEVVEPGWATVPARITARSLETLPLGQIHLSSVFIPDTVPVSDEERIRLIKGGPALQIEGTGETGTRRRIRLRLYTPTSAQAVSPSLAEWQEKQVPLATIAPQALREALGPCILLARERVEASEETPDMDHALVLFRFDPHALVCTATTRFAIAQSTLPWTRALAHVPCSHALVDERMLRWMMAALKQETRPVNLMLVPQEASAMLLLFSLSHCTLICRSKTAPIPLVWERRIAAPSSHALLLSRSLLVKALDFLSAGQARNTNRYISFGVSNHRLCLQWDPLAQTDHSALCQLPIVNTVADIEPVLVHLQQARRMLRQIKGPALCLERGTMMLRQKKGATVEPVPVGFVRFSLPAEETTRIMLTVAEYPAPPSADPADSSESREKGETLAHVSSSSNPL